MRKKPHLSLFARHCRVFTLAMASLALVPIAANAALQVQEATESITFSSNYTSVVLSKTGGELLQLAYRESPSGPWQQHAIGIQGRRRTTSSAFDTSDITPIIRWVTLGDTLVVKCEIQQGTLFWNFWYALSDSSRVIESGRFVYGDSTSLTLAGIGVVVDAPGYTATTQAINYSDVGGSHSGNYTDFTKDGNGVRLYVSNMAEQTMETSGSETIIWCRRSNTNWGTKIDYRRMALVPFKSGESLDAYNGFAKLKVFDHEMTNVELAGSWVMRYKRSSGEVRDWFNPSGDRNGFQPGEGTSSVNKVGFWRDDWTTGALLRNVKMTYDITGDPFYFMRFIDLMDYQIDRENEYIKVQWGINQAWNENYPMGRVEAAMDVYDLAGWDYYRDIAVNSCDFYFGNENFTEGKGHLETGGTARNYSDMAYNFEGIYRADIHNNYKWDTLFDDYYSWLDQITWNASHGLYGHLLGATINYHWGRGHGWWLETLPNILDYYNRPNRATILAHYVTAVGNLIQYQNGIWYKQVDTTNTFLDTSAGTMIASGMLNGFLRGYVGVEALESALTAISTVTNEYLEEDGTITGTDRGGTVAGSTDPFPYTQEGYVHFARDLGIREIVQLSKRNVLPSTFAEGVMITDANGGTVTDANGDVIDVDGVIVIDNMQANKRSMRLLGSGTRNLTLHGMQAGQSYLVTNRNLTEETESSATIVADGTGALAMSLDLAGEHQLIVYPQVEGSIWANLPRSPEGFFELGNFGWTFDENWPYVHMQNVGWTYVVPAPAEGGFWMWWGTNR